MAEIGFDAELVIPSVLIDMDSGDVLVEWFNNNSMNMNSMPSIGAVIVFDNLPQSAKVKYEIILNPMDKSSKQFLMDWMPVYQLIKNDTEFDPKFFFYYLYEASLVNYSNDKYKN